LPTIILDSSLVSGSSDERKTMKALVIILFGFISCDAFSQGKKMEPPERVPQFNLIGAENQMGVLSMECEGTQPFSRIICKFNQAYLARLHSSDDVQEKVAEMSKWDVRAFKKEKCGGLAKSLPKAMADIKVDQVPERAIASKDELNTVNAACDCGDSDCLRRTLRNWIEAEQRDCRIATRQFTLTFERVGPNKWISNAGPKGLCEVVNVTTIERENDHLWTFTQLRADADKGELCNHLEVGSRARFSWKYGTNFSANCRNIRFTVF
jgi:hypothetical protein